MKKMIVVSKDAMCTSYLPAYGNRFWKTPNIDALVQKGTVFMRHYTAAPSTYMSFYSMLTGLYAHETDFEMYERKHVVYQGETYIDRMVADGYSCHVMWDPHWNSMFDYFDVFHNNAIIHSVQDFQQPVGVHFVHDGFLVESKELQEKTFNRVTNEIKSILSSEDNVFLWIHFPHVINGYTCYGGDIEGFDKYIGFIRGLVSDDSIVITADHGNMNGSKGKLCYGFDVNQSAIRIPLITPRIDGKEKIEIPTSSVDLFRFLLDKEIPLREFLYSDCAYKAQRSRKLAIMYKNFKYIYNKRTKIQELYDLDWDVNEGFSLISDTIYDVDRRIISPSREMYFYPYWQKVEEARRILREEKKRIWQEGHLPIVLKSNAKDCIRPIYDIITRKKL